MAISVCEAVINVARAAAEKLTGFKRRQFQADPKFQTAFAFIQDLAIQPVRLIPNFKPRSPSRGPPRLFTSNW